MEWAKLVVYVTGLQAEQLGKITEWKTLQGVQQMKHSEEFLEFIYFQIGRIALEFNTKSCPTHLRVWTRIQI